MRLNELLSPWVSLGGEASKIECLSLVQDHRKVQPGALFVAVKGAHFDGHQKLNEAFSAGAVGAIVNQGFPVPQKLQDRVFSVQDTKSLLSPLAVRFFGAPSEKLFTMGVTGTNGKTSTAYLVEHLLNFVGISTGVIGTVDHHLGAKVWPSELTTPGPIELQSRLFDFVQAGAKALAMEVSSHALDQKRAEGIAFDVGVFTNLTRDHLDYHQTEENYFKAKELLFTEALMRSPKKEKVAVINFDDPAGPRLRVPKAIKLWSFGKEGDFAIQNIQLGLTSTNFDLQTPFGKVHVTLPLCGKHNVSNAVGALAAALVVHPKLSDLVSGLACFAGVPGRLQLVSNAKKIPVYVDYAHTPDALENVLRSLKEAHPQGRLICVFGCGGDRDAGKRPLMGQIAGQFADVVMVTSDNPRTEDPDKIISDIMKGLASSKNVMQERDRRSAIARVLLDAKAGDVVIIAGKGHEDYQIVGLEKKSFSDVEVVKEVLG